MRIAQSTVTGMGTRVVSALVLWISIPLLLNFLGEERNGIWVVLGAALACIGIADLGFGNSVLNALAAALAADDRERCRRIVSTGLLLLGVIAGVLLLLLLPLAGMVDWPSVLNAPVSSRGEISWAVRATVLVFAVNLPLSLLPKILTAGQQGHLANLIAFAGTIAGFGALLLAIRMEAGLAGIVVAVHGTAALAWVAAGAWLFLRAHPWMAPSIGAADWGWARRLWDEGWKFFVLQIGGVISLQIDALIISWRISADAVTPFYNAQKLFLIAAMVQTVSFPYFWAAFAEAQARQDHAWMRRALHRGTAISILLTAALALPIALVAEPLTHWWLSGRQNAMPGTALVWWHCGWVLLASSMQVAASVLNAHGRLRGQLIYLPLTACLNLALSIWWASAFGPEGVIAASVVSFGLCSLLPIWLEASRLLKRQIDATPLPSLHS